MEQLMPMMMMQNMLGGGGSNDGTDSDSSSALGGMDMMMRMMFPEMFEEEVVPMWSSAAAFGTRRRQGQDEIGVLELRLVPPTMTSPRPSLRLICGGVPVLLRPDELVSIQSWITTILSNDNKIKAMFPGETKHRTGTLDEVWEEAMNMEDSLKQERMVSTMMKSG